MAPPQSSSTSSSPKLEDFLGGEQGGHHHGGGGDDRDAFPLGLDSFYFNHHHPSEEEVDHRQQQQLDHHHHNQQQQYHQFQTQTLSYYPGIQWLQQAPPSPDPTNNSNNQSPHHHHLSTADSGSQIPPISCGEIDGVGGGDEIPSLRNWVSQHYSNQTHSLLDPNHHQLGGCGGGGGGGDFDEAAAAGGGGELQSLTLSMSPGSKSSCVPSPTSNTVSAEAMGKKQLDG